jgi:uncharacterized protein (TIGR02300 family)
MTTKTADREELRALRGTKRTCQSEECGSRFYDLNRDPITCPICGTVYEMVLRAPQPAPAAPARQPKKPSRPEPKEYEAESGKPEPEDELAAVAGEEGDEASEGDEVFLEEMEEEGSNVAGIIDAPIEDGDEKT